MDYRDLTSSNKIQNYFIYEINKNTCIDKINVQIQVLHTS